MAFSAKHRIHAIAFPSSVYITQLRELTTAKNFELFREHSTGEEAPQHSGGLMSAPDAAFRTPQLKALLDLCNGGEQGLCRAYTSGTVSLYYRKGKKRGLREAVASTVHDRFDGVNNAFLFWDSISGSAGEIAEANARLQFVSDDGDSKPLTHVGSTALAGASATADHYVIGPVYLNGTLVDAVIDWNLDNQLTLDEAIDAGSKFKTFSAIDRWQPRLTLSSNDLTLEDTYDEEGTALTSLSIYLRKQKANGLLVPKATAEHIKITATAGSIFVPQTAGQSAATQVVVLIDKPDASTAPFTINTAIAITT